MHSGVVRTLSKTSSRPSVEEVKDELRRRTLAVGKQDQSIRTDLFGSVKHTAIPARSLRFFRIPVRLSVPTAAPLVTSITSPCNAHPSRGKSRYQACAVTCMRRGLPPGHQWPGHSSFSPLRRGHASAATRLNAMASTRMAKVHEIYSSVVPTRYILTTAKPKYGWYRRHQSKRAIPKRSQTVRRRAHGHLDRTTTAPTLPLCHQRCCTGVPSAWETYPPITPLQ